MTKPAMLAGKVQSPKARLRLGDFGIVTWSGQIHWEFLETQQNHTKSINILSPTLSFRINTQSTAAV